MTALSSDVRRPAGPVSATAGSGGWSTEALLALRDEGMAEYLREAAGEGAPGLTVHYTPRWWDGAAWSACLHLQWRDVRWRVVRDDEDLVCLPHSTRQARRLLRRRRRPEPSAALAPLLSGSATTGAAPVVQVLEPDDARSLAARRRERRRRLTAGPDPGVDPRQGVLRFEDDDAPRPPPAPVPAPSGPVVLVVQEGDWSACRSPACGGLTLLPAPGSKRLPDEVCPRCGRR